MTGSISDNLSIHLNTYRKLLVMIRSALSGQNIFYRLNSFFLDYFLQNCLAVIKKLFMFNIV